MQLIDEKDFKDNISRKIKFYRKESQEKTAELASISTDTLSAIERALSVPSSLNIHIVEDNIDFKMLISHLNKKEQEIFALHYNSNYTSTEIAELLDMNINTVKSIITRAKTKLQKYIREEDINNEKQKQ